MTSFFHEPVLLTEVLDCLCPARGQVFADGTLGGGGHSAAILKRMGEGTLYGIDRDWAAIEAASERLKDYPGFHALHGNFHDIRGLLPGASCWTADCSTSAFHPTSWTGRKGAFPTMKTLRWICAWIRLRG